MLWPQSRQVVVVGFVCIHESQCGHAHAESSAHNGHSWPHSGGLTRTSWCWIRSRCSRSISASSRATRCSSVSNAYLDVRRITGNSNFPPLQCCCLHPLYLQYPLLQRNPKGSRLGGAIPNLPALTGRQRQLTGGYVTTLPLFPANLAASIADTSRGGPTPLTGAIITVEHHFTSREIYCSSHCFAALGMGWPLIQRRMVRGSLPISSRANLV